MARLIWKGSALVGAFLAGAAALHYSENYIQSFSPTPTTDSEPPESPEKIEIAKLKAMIQRLQADSDELKSIKPLVELRKAHMDDLEAKVQALQAELTSLKKYRDEQKAQVEAEEHASNFFDVACSKDAPPPVQGTNWGKIIYYDNVYEHYTFDNTSVSIEEGKSYRYLPYAFEGNCSHRVLELACMQNGPTIVAPDIERTASGFAIKKAGKMTTCKIAGETLNDNYKRPGRLTVIRRRDAKPE